MLCLAIFEHFLDDLTRLPILATEAAHTEAICLQVKLLVFGDSGCYQSRRLPLLLLGHGRRAQLYVDEACIGCVME